jgi:hypothetical protein
MELYPGLVIYLALLFEFAQLPSAQPPLLPTYLSTRDLSISPPLIARKLTINWHRCFELPLVARASKKDENRGMGVFISLTAQFF